MYNDLPEEEEDWDTPARQVEIKSTSLEALSADAADDLQPGGAASAGLQTPKESEAQFRELFIQHEQARTIEEPVRKIATPSESLESMPVRELRRLAEQRGVVGFSDMKKKELLSALRQQVEPAVERTLDLTEVAEVAEVSELSEVAETEAVTLE